jgi:iron complex outermembrane receptor protein
MLRVFSAIIFTVLASAAMSAQSSSSVTGRVTETRIPGLPQPAKGVKILLEPAVDRGPAYEAKSDDAGRFRFGDVPRGAYILIAECAYCSEGSVRKAVEVAEGSDASADIELLIGIGREYVSISASRVQSLEEVSKSVSVIDGQEMRDRADFTLADALRTVPGFRVQQYGGFGRTAVIKSRGLRNHDTAVLLDGVRLRDASSITGDASAFIGDITLTSVSRIEVLRGSGSSLYGTNAIGGTVDFQTPRAAKGWHGQVGGAAGGLGLGRFRGNLSKGSADGTWGFTSGVSRTVYTKGLDGNDDAHNTNLQGRFDVSPDDLTTVSAKLFFSESDVRLNASPDTVGILPASGVIDVFTGLNFSPDADDPDSVQRGRFLSASVSATRAWRNDLVMTASYSFLRTRRSNQDGLLGPGYQSEYSTVYSGTVNTVNVRFHWTPLRGHDVKFGYEFEGERFVNDGFTPSGAGDYSTRATQSGSSFFVQDLVTLLGGRLQLAGSVRAQTFGLGDTRFSLSSAPYSGTGFENPGTGVTFDGAVTYSFASTGTRIRAHAGNGYRIPSLYERFGTFFSTWPSPSFIALGDPQLKPERSIAYDAGVEQRLSDGRVRLSAVFYYTDLLETVGYGYSARSIPGVSRPYGGYFNTKGGLARGGEFSADITPDSSTRIFTSYTYSNADQRSVQVAGSGTVEAFGLPKHQFSVIANRRFGRTWVNFDLVATGRYLAPIYSSTYFRSVVYSFRGNRRADLTVGRTFPLRRDSQSVRVFATAENVLGHLYYENGFRTPGRTARIGVSYGF